MKIYLKIYFLKRGYSQQARCKCFPDIVDFGQIPVALPQRRLALIRNPLAVPITVQLSVPHDGYEIPLVLNIQNVNTPTPINVNDPVHFLTEILQNEYNHKSEGQNEDEYIEKEHKREKDKDIEKCKQDLLDRTSSTQSIRSVEDECSSYSTEFEEMTLG